MDNAPNSPNDAYAAPDGAVTPEMVVCPTCGESVLATARFCSACGAELIAPVVAQPAAPAASMPAPAPTPAPAMADALASGAASAADASATGAAPEPAAFAPGEGKACTWCGAANARDAATCVSCGASFPTPEGTEAMERAAKARIDDMQEEIQKARMRSGWWPFRLR